MLDPHRESVRPAAVGRVGGSPQHAPNALEAAGPDRSASGSSAGPAAAAAERPPEHDRGGAVAVVARAAGRPRRSRGRRRRRARRALSSRTSSSSRSAPPAYGERSTTSASSARGHAAAPVGRGDGDPLELGDRRRRGWRPRGRPPGRPPRRPGSATVGSRPATPSLDQPVRPGVGAEVVRLQRAIASTSAVGRRPGRSRHPLGRPGRRGVGPAQVERLGVVQLGPLLGDHPGQPAGARQRRARRRAGTPRGRAPRPPPPPGGRSPRRPAWRPRARRAGAPVVVVRREVDLLAPGVGGDHERRRPTAPVSTASTASTSSEQTPYTGISRTKPRVRAVTSPTRSPVNGPGPTPTAIAVRSWRTSPVSRSARVDQRRELLAVLHRLLGDAARRRRPRRRAARR